MDKGPGSTAWSTLSINRERASVLNGTKELILREGPMSAEKS